MQDDFEVSKEAVCSDQTSVASNSEVNMESKENTGDESVLRSDN